MSFSTLGIVLLTRTEYRSYCSFIPGCSSLCLSLPSSVFLSPPSPQTAKLVKELQAMDKVCGCDPSHVQQDIQLRELRDFGANAVQQLGSLGARNPEMVPAMQLMFSQAGLPPAPSPTGSRASSVPSSARSSASSVTARYYVTSTIEPCISNPHTYSGTPL